MKSTTACPPTVESTEAEHKFIQNNPGCIDMVLLVNNRGDLCEYQEASAGKPVCGNVVFPVESGMLSIYKKATLNHLVREQHIDPRSVVHLDRVVVTFALAV